MKITKVGLPAENSFLDRMIRYLYSSGGPGRKEESSSGHILRAKYSMGPAPPPGQTPTLSSLELRFHLLASGTLLTERARVLASWASRDSGKGLQEWTSPRSFPQVLRGVSRASLGGAKLVAAGGASWVGSARDTSLIGLAPGSWVSVLSESHHCPERCPETENGVALREVWYTNTTVSDWDCVASYRGENC